MERIWGKSSVRGPPHIVRIIIIKNTLSSVCVTSKAAVIKNISRLWSDLSKVTRKKKRKINVMGLRNLFLSKICF